MSGNEIARPSGSTAVVPHDGGGDALIETPLPGGERAQAGDAGVGALTDAQHFAAFATQLGSALARGGIRDRALVARITAEGEATYAGLADGSHAFRALGTFAARLLRAGVRNPDVIEASVGVAANYVEAVTAQAQGDDGGRAYRATRQILAREWGKSYVGNVSVIQRWLRDQPAAVEDLFLYGETGAGRVANDPGVLRWLLVRARGDSMTPRENGRERGGSMDTDPDRDAIERELAELKPLLGDRRSAYHRGPKAGAMQARYRELLQAKEAGTSAPPRVSGDEAELMELKGMMGDRRSAYWRGSRATTLQSRYRELLEKLGR